MSEELDMLTQGGAVERGWLGLDEVIKVVLTGSAGRMGREVVRAISGEEGVRLVGAVDVSSEGQDAGLVAGIGEIGIPHPFGSFSGFCCNLS